MKITNEIKDKIIVITVSGKVIADDAIQFRREVTQLIEGVPKDQSLKVVLDLSDVSMIDNSGLGALVAFYTMVQKRAGKILLVVTQQGLTNILSITKLTRVFDVFATVGDAIAVFNEKPASV